MSYILAIDPATQYGLAVLDHHGQRIQSCSERLGASEIAKKLGKWAGFYCRVDALIVFLKDTGGLDIVAFEEPIRYGLRSPNFISPQLCGIIMAICEIRNVAYVSAHNASVKKHATGNGQAKKPEILAAARKRWGHVKDDNEADALWIADWVRVNMEDE